MKRKFFYIVFLIFLTGSFSLHAAFLKNVPQKITQPDGTVISCLASGDEFHNWLHDDNNYTIIQDPETGFYVYADVANGKLVPSSWIVGKHNPELSGLQPGLNISDEEYARQKNSRYQNTGFKSFKNGPNTGHLNNLVIYIRFKDQDYFTGTRALYDRSFNGESTVSLKSYFRDVSESQLDINSYFFPQTEGTEVLSYQDPNPRSYYQPYNVVTNPGGYYSETEMTQREHGLLKDAIESVRSEIELMDLDLDMDDDGNVDNIVFIVEGNTGGWSDLLWPHKWAMSSHDIYLKGSKVWWYNLQLSKAFSVSVICHEMFHSLGAPDFYRYNNRNMTPVGPWDLMAETTTPPQHMGVYSKMKYGGWLDEIPSISTGGTYTLEPLSENPFSAYKILSPNSSREFFVIEYRAKSGQYESSLPGSGLIIYRINSGLNGNASGPPDEVYVYRPGGTTTDNGDLYKANFSTQSGNISFDDNTNPSCFLSNGSPGGIIIKNIGNAGSSISFDVVVNEGFQAPRNLTASSSVDEVSLSWQKPNAGTGTLAGYRVYRNNTLVAVIDNPDRTSFLDKDLDDGFYTYYVKAIYRDPDGESTQSNLAYANIGASGKADLLITDVSVSQEKILPGGTIDVSLKLINGGNVLAGLSMMRVFLSKDLEQSEDDRQIAYGRMDPIEPGGFSQVSGDGLVIPQDLGLGSWHLLFIADADKNVQESDEENNKITKPLTIGIAGFAAPKGLTATASGTVVNLNWQKPESGNGTHVGYKVYRNNKLIRQINDQATNFYSDRNLDNGQYTYYVTATYNYPIGESGASNEASVTISEDAKPDLITRYESVSSLKLKPGDNFSLTFRYENAGLAPAPESIVRLFFSKDGSLDDQDIHFAWGQIENLGVGGYKNITGTDLSVPEELTGGKWYILFVADADKQVMESNENNNIRSIEVNLVSSFFNPPLNLYAKAGINTVILNWDEPEMGNTNLSGYKIFRNHELIHIIENAGSREYIDASLGFGTYNYNVSAIYTNPDGESIKSNTQTITLSSNKRPDLLIETPIISPIVVNPGDYVSISCTFINNGTARADQSTIRIFLSKDKIPDDNDIEIAYGYLEPLDEDFFYNITGDDILIPGNTSHGLWQVLFIADADSEINESVETNNVSSTILQVGSAQFMPPKNLSGSSAGRDINLFWEEPDPGNGVLAGYKVYRNSKMVALINDQEDAGFTDAALQPGSYTYYVTAVYSHPNGESGASNSISVNISEENKPDLVVENQMISPIRIKPGGQVDISCRLKNLGSFLAQNSLLLVVLSKDIHLDQEDYILAYGNIDAIEPGAFSEVVGNGISFPEEIMPGEWYALFIADADKQVDEYNEDNNISYLTIELESEELNPPGNLYLSLSGNKVVLSWQDPEKGSGIISGYGIYRNGERINTVTNTIQNVYSDTGLPPGKYSYFVTAIYSNPEGESSSSNTVETEVLASDNPDLIITDIDLDPYQLDVGDRISLWCNLRNLGNSASGKSILRVYISKDTQIDELDEIIAWGEMESVEKRSKISVRGENLDMPSSISPGLWYIIFLADADEEVIETDEENNVSYSSIIIGESIFNPPKGLQGIISGMSTQLFWNPPDPGGPELISYKLFRNGQYHATIGVDDNQPFVDGPLNYETYSYSLTALYENPAGESIPSNEFVVSVSTEIKPDLIIRNAQVSPHNVDPGGIISISCDLLNIGTNQSGSSHLRLFLSRDEQLDEGDHSLAYGMMDPLAPGSVTSISGEDLYVPANLEPGDWNILFVADADEEIRESVEDNNISIFPIDISKKLPDLIISDIYLIRNYANPGGMMRITLFVYNMGSSKSSRSKAGIYLSADDNLSVDDVLLSEPMINEIQGYSQVLKNEYVTIPPNTTRGRYYLIARVDDDNTISETEDNNNELAIPITVGTLGIDNKNLNNDFLVYPNPAKDEIFIKSTTLTPGKISLALIDQLGRSIYQEDIEIQGVGAFRLDISFWDKGIYYVKIQAGNKQFISTFVKY